MENNYADAEQMPPVRQQNTGQINPNYFPDKVISFEGTKLPPQTYIKDYPFGLKNDSSKLRYDLISAIALKELAEVYTYGATKYDDNNWRKGILWTRIFAAAMRHMWAWFRGQDIDPESGMYHLAHAAWAMFTLLEYAKTKPELDNRFKDEFIGVPK